MILMNGFGQTLAFMVAKGDEKYNLVFNLMKAWLVENKNLVPVGHPRDFLKNISRLSQEKYMDAQKEALAFLEWVKRYAAMEYEGGK